MGQVDRLGNGAADERLRGAHHFEVRHVVMLRLPRYGLEGAIEHRQMLGFRPLRDRRAVFLDVLDGVEFLDVGDDARRFPSRYSRGGARRRPRRD